MLTTNYLPSINSEFPTDLYKNMSHTTDLHTSTTEQTDHAHPTAVYNTERTTQLEKG